MKNSNNPLKYLLAVVVAGGLLFTSSQTPVEEPQEPSYPAMVDNTIPDNEHARKDAIAQLEATRASVHKQAEEKAQIALIARKKEQVAEAKAQAVVVQKRERVIVAEKKRVVVAQKREQKVIAEKQAQKVAVQKVAVQKAPQKVAVAPPKRQAQKAVVQAKPKKQVVVSRNSEVSTPTRVFEASAYVAFCDTGCTGVTATGMDVSNTIYYNGMRVIAVDPSVIPLHSIVRVTYADGTSFVAVAGDTGGAIDGFRIDILVGSLSEALKFGRQNVTVKLLK